MISIGTVAAARAGDSFQLALGCDLRQHNFHFKSLRKCAISTTT